MKKKQDRVTKILNIAFLIVIGSTVLYAIVLAIYTIVTGGGFEHISLK